MIKRISVIFILVSSSLLLSQCKESGKKEIGYIVGDAVPIYGAPDLHSRPVAQLTINSSFRVIESNIPDHSTGGNSHWYKIESDRVHGYLSYDEGVLRSNMMTFSPAKPDSGGMVTASSLRLRKAPGLHSETIDLLPRGTVVRIQEVGSLLQEIDGKKDRWVRVQTEKGKSGFCFLGYLYQGSMADVKQRSLTGWEKVDGWVRIKTTEPSFVQTPGGEPVAKNENNFCPNLILSLEQNDFTRVSEKQVFRGVSYYHIQENWGISECAGTYTGWISASEVEYIPDFFKYSRQGVTEYDPAMLTAINDALKGQTSLYFNSEGRGDLNVQDLKIEEFNVEHPDPAHRYFIIRATQGPKRTKERGPETRNFALVLRKDGDIYKADDSHGDIKLRDIDGDGQMEIITTDSFRASGTMSVYAIVNGSLEKAVQIDSPPNERVEFKDPFVKLYEYSASSDANGKYETKEEIHYLQFKDGRYIPVDAKVAGF